MRKTSRCYHQKGNEAKIMLKQNHNFCFHHNKSSTSFPHTHPVCDEASAMAYYAS